MSADPEDRIDAVFLLTLALGFIVLAISLLTNAFHGTPAACPDDLLDISACVSAGAERVEDATMVPMLLGGLGITLFAAGAVPYLVRRRRWVRLTVVAYRMDVPAIAARQLARDKGCDLTNRHGEVLVRRDDAARLIVESSPDPDTPEGPRPKSVGNPPG